MSDVEEFLTTSEEQEIIEAIRDAEMNTSGEIRVHLEARSEKEAIARAKEVFYYLKMDQTIAQNGVLFYLGIEDKKFAIIGDKGIDQVVPSDFWNEVRDVVINEFKHQHFVQGLLVGISKAGLKLKEFFPLLPDDRNELSNTVSKG